MCNSSTFLFHTNNIYIYIYFTFFFTSFDKRVMQVCENIMGLESWESFQRPLMRCQIRLSIYFGGIRFCSMEDCAPFGFLMSWVLVNLYLWSKFYIFDRPIEEEYVSQVKGG
jgi:hypothetical protein